MKIWEVHALRVGGAIRSTPDGEAEVEGLVLTEKAYLVVVRDFRPEALVALVRAKGVQGAAEALVAHFAAPAAVQASGGRKLVVHRGASMAPGPVLRRSDEVPEAVPGAHR